MLGIKKCSLGRSSTQCQQTEIIFLIFSGHATVNRRFSHSLLEVFHCVSWLEYQAFGFPTQAMDSKSRGNRRQGRSFLTPARRKIGGLTLPNSNFNSSGKMIKEYFG
jgi:hypothetical protein